MFRRSRKFLLRTAWATPLLLLAACQGLIPRGTNECGSDAGCAPVVPLHEPRVIREPSLMSLAHDLDHLEKHIDLYGSVVAKSPDVWGQARLTQHREDFEKEMKKDLCKFEVKLNGASNRADSAYAVYAQAIEVAASGQAATQAPAAASTPLTPPNSNIPAVTLTPIAPAEGLKAGGINVEPAVELAQKKRYLDLLNQLRRESEGGDTADAPGYQLNLLRIPVSLLPGRHTENGHGAEVTFTIDPVVGDDLLPTTFRRMAVNDVVEHLGLPFTELLWDVERLDYYTEDVQKFLRFITRMDDLQSADRQRVSESDAESRMAALAGSLTEEEYKAFSHLFTADMNDKVVGFLKAGKLPWATAIKVPSQPPTTTTRPVANPVRTFALNNVDTKSLRSFVASQAPPKKTVHAPPAAVGGPKPAATPLAQPFQLGKFSTLPFSTGVENRLAFPTSQLNEVYGEAYLFEIGLAVKTALANDVAYTGYAHLPDVQSLLRSESQSAYQLLAKNRHLLDSFCTPDLVRDIRSRDVTRITHARQEYREAVARVTGSWPDNVNSPDSYKGLATRQFSLTAALAWGLIVDSALLTDKLLTDLKESATAKGKAPPCPTDEWPKFFLPDPPADARQLFADYVRLRWPVHVFALDPMTQEQNLLDSLQTHRETQLALSVAFTSGRIGSRIFTQYARRLQAQYDTVALNRTQVGFAHGDNTFGWRFYPRFQTPPTQSNVTTLFRDQIVGGPTPDALLRQRRLEPGPRECVALVIMPSFVPTVTVDAESNWFALANPKNKSLDHSQALRLSRHVRALERCPPGVGDADRYRDGEWQRLQTRVKQLGDRLPSQTMTVPVPVVNTTSGFELFSNGTTDLAPSLYGFYGAPGVSPDEETTLFLVGDHFSPLQTKVIVGNREITSEKQRMLSRQVMQVTVPTGVLSLPGDDDRRWVHAHVATPYGVSREVYIPLYTPPPAPPAEKKEPKPTEKKEPKPTEKKEPKPEDKKVPKLPCGDKPEGRCLVDDEGKPLPPSVLLPPPATPAPPTVPMTPPGK